MRLNVGRVYAVKSEHGCSVTFADGTPCAEIPAGVGMFVAQAGDMLVSDELAVVRELPNGLQLLHGQMMKEQASGGHPAGYKRVEYLEGDGSQVISTGLIPDGETGFKASVQMPVTPASASYFAGTQTRSNTGALWIKFVDYKLSMQYGSTHGVGTIFVIAATNAANINSRNDIDFNYKNNRLMGLAGQEKMELPSELGTVQQYWFTLFKATFAGNASYDPSSRFRIYNWQHTQGDKVVRSYIPALDETGAPCMFDLVSRKPYYNVGTGDFLYPTESTTYSLRRVLPDWGKLTEHGLRRLYHAPAGYQGELYDYAIENGFKPIVETEQPEEGYWIPEWHEREDCIELEWVETEPPMDEPLTATE